MVNMYLVKFDTRALELRALEHLQVKVGDSVIHNGDKYALTEEQKVKLDSNKVKYNLLKRV